MLGLLGSRDALLRQLEENLAADIHVRGNRITLRGSAADVAFAEQVFRELLTLQESRLDDHRRCDPPHHRHARRTGRGRRGTQPGARPEHRVAARPHDPAEDAEPEALRRRDRQPHHRVRHRSGRYRQDLPGDGQGGAGAAGQAGQPDHPDPAGGRGRGAARLPARHPERQDRPVPAPAVRRAARHARPGVDPAADGGRHHRGRAAGLHAWPHPQRRVHHPRRGAEHHARADEDVPHPARLRRPRSSSPATSPRSTCPAGSGPGCRWSGRSSPTSTTSLLAASPRPMSSGTGWSATSSTPTRRWDARERHRRAATGRTAAGSARRQGEGSAQHRRRDQRGTGR